MLATSKRTSNRVAGGDAAASSGEEAIRVSIRMRPRNSKESNGKTDNGIWKVLEERNSVTRRMPSGQNETFSYDRTFGESSTTQQVYEHTSRVIVDSVVNGLNGTIFVYGQTSSGKTFTMQGPGTLADGSINGGIIHMAADDIFSHFEKKSEREFSVQVSMIEIYNEEVFDLLASGDSKDDAILKIREDKQRGVFVNSNEIPVHSTESLLSAMSTGEKKRSVATTKMNERSSRSHTIFRIRVESRLKETKKEDDEGVDDSDDEALRGDEIENKLEAMVSTLNLVDLAGSESVRHTDATGDRQKEGGKINRSLLTLSRVIEGRGENAAHINYRDSKLTRILKPSLSGNSRITMICCTSPSELYIGETRSTLQFASRAKLVKTNAQVNIIMDDKSYINRLKRQLEEALRTGPNREDIAKMKALEEKASIAEYAAFKAKEDLAEGVRLLRRTHVEIEKLRSQLSSKEEDRRQQEEAGAMKLAEAVRERDATRASNVKLTEQVSSLKSANEDLMMKLEQANLSMAVSKEEASSATSPLTELCTAKESVDERVTSPENELRLLIGMHYHVVREYSRSCAKKSYM